MLLASVSVNATPNKPANKVKHQATCTVTLTGSTPAAPYHMTLTMNGHHYTAGPGTTVLPQGTYMEVTIVPTGASKSKHYFHASSCSQILNTTTPAYSVLWSNVAMDLNCGAASFAVN